MKKTATFDALKIITLDLSVTLSGNIASGALLTNALYSII